MREAGRNRSPARAPQPAPEDPRGGAETTPRIVFDARWIGPHGIGRFARASLRRLAAATPLAIGGSPSNPLDPLRLSWALARERAGCFFSPGYNAPLAARIPFVLTLHDLNQIHVPENSSAARRAYFRHVVRSACRRAAAVVTVSEFSRNQILSWTNLAEQRVVTVGNGVDATFSPQGPRHVLGKPYLLYVGNRRPHKNLPRLLAAFAATGLAREVALLLSGTADAATVRQLRACGLSDAVHFAGPIAEAALPAYYRGALALVVPSLYEGFGLPALEAMACGTPVLASRSAALPEVLGDCALFMDARDVESMAEALRTLLGDDGLRERLRACGPRRARLFDWDAAMHRLQAVLRRASLPAADAVRA